MFLLFLSLSHGSFRLSDVDVLLQHARWALDRREEEGVRVFTGRPSLSTDDRRLDPANVLDFLSSYPIATRLYLEYIINTQRSKVKTNSHNFMKKFLLLIISGGIFSHKTSFNVFGRFASY